MAEVTLSTRSGELGGYLATPEGAGPWPGVVLVHEAFGLTDDMRRIADRFAGHGYLALAPDFFAGGGNKLACVRAAFRELRSGQGRIFARIDEARGWLAAHGSCSGRVGVAGFCMGGGFALIAAPRAKFAAASVNYGQVPENAADVLAGTCPMVASYGGRDRAMHGHAERLEEALGRLGVAHDVKTYPNAGHSFLNRNRGAVPFVLAKVFGAGYHGPSAEDAWRRMVAFFDEHLRGGATAR